MKGDPKRSDLLASVKHVTLSRNRREILKDINLAIQPGRVVTVIGPNGAGKSTLVKVILGLITPSQGQLWRRPGLSVGYVPQKLNMDPVLPLSVHRLMTLTKRASRDEVHKALTETGVAQRIDSAVHGLSGGEFQRVLIARALLRRPDLLVLDEPVQGVDFVGEAALYKLISEIRDRRGCGILMVSHDLHVVMGATDWVVCLNRKICCEGEPERVIQHPEYAEMFGHQASSFAVFPHHETSHADDPLDEAVCDEPVTHGRSAL
ncbi:MAG: ATP-binding cassette domain-containing protein [Magnetococcales bacterium]|nr:ATP-binding cassette domain-containing protein [Magnetococcales bacterium]